MDPIFKLTSIRKISIGFFLTAASFAVVAIAQDMIDGGATPSIVWQLLAYVLLTAGEVMISITGLEFSYTPGSQDHEIRDHGGVAVFRFAGQHFHQHR